MIDLLRILFLGLILTVTVFCCLWASVNGLMRLESVIARRKAHRQRLIELLESINSKLTTRP